jgi:hypothetical protein
MRPWSVESDAGLLQRAGRACPRASMSDAGEKHIRYSALLSADKRSAACFKLV